jgi:hypothetical protein
LRVESDEEAQAREEGIGSTIAVEMSQLLDGYVLPPSSTVLLNNYLLIALLNGGVILTMHTSDLTTIS